jgi:predicted O-linked N-acetylglucosamine transferase (SPINDLY family)
MPGINIWAKAMNYHVALHQNVEAEAKETLKKSVTLLEEGHFSDAQAELVRLARDMPGNAEIHNALGNAYVLQGDLDKALAAYETASSLKPNSEEFLLNIANVLQLKGDPTRARSFASKAYEFNQNSIEANLRLAILDIAEEKLNSALFRLNDILKNNPRFAPALLQRAIIHLKNGKSHLAFMDVNNSIEEDPKNSFGYLIRGLLFLDNNHIDAAEIDFTKARHLGLINYELEKAEATLYYKKKQNKKAISKYIKLYKKSKDDYDVLLNIGLIYLEEKNHCKARLYFQKILRANPENHDARNGLANTLRLMGEFKQAISEYEKILSAEQYQKLAVYNLAGTYLELKDFQTALKYIDEAISISNVEAEYHLLKARIYFEAADYELALKNYERVVELDHQNAEALLYLGHIHRINRNLDKTIEFYEKALEKDPGNIYLESDLLFARLQVCDWSTFYDKWPKISEHLNSCDALASPFFMVALSNDPDQQKLVARAYSKGQHSLKDALDPIEFYTGHKKIKIGYYSADFNNHATMHLMAGLFEAHDRNKFELYAFSFGPKIADEMRSRAEAAFDHFIDVSDFTDRATALISRHLEIDIAVDLKGYTAHSRPSIFAYRAAPVQINYLGFPGTMGAEFIDYIIADPIIIPEAYEKFYTEKILRLPMSYQVNDQTRPPIERAFTRKDIGLPENKFIYSSFNTNYKILPETLDSWSRILKSVKNSIFWILADNNTAKRNICREFEARGVNKNRIVFAERTDPKLNLARQDCADLFLDCFPCTAHTTASDAVFSGVPLITLIGDTFASRVAASVLSAVGLPDLITKNRAEYEERAIYFGRNPHEAKNISNYLKKTIRLTPLFDTAKTARDLEKIYIEALEKIDR